MPFLAYGIAGGVAFNVAPHHPGWRNRVWLREPEGLPVRQSPVSGTLPRLGMRSLKPAEKGRWMTIFGIFILIILVWVLIRALGPIVRRRRS